MSKSKYINSFNTTAEYNNYIESAYPEFPNVGYDKEAGVVNIRRTSPNSHLFYGELVDATQNIPEINLFANNLLRKTYIPTVDIISNEFYIDDWGTLPEYNALGTNFLTNKTNIKSIKKFTGLDTSTVTNMYGAFGGCSSLTTVDLSDLDTSNVTVFTRLFEGCSSLTTLDLSNLTTSSLIEMISVFDGCSSLTTLDLSNLNTSSVTSIGSIFNNCSSLTTVDLSGCDFSSITNINYAFNKTNVLTDVYITVEATLMKLTNNLSSQGRNYIPSSATIHYNNGTGNVDYKWQNSRWTPQS